MQECVLHLDCGAKGCIYHKTPVIICLSKKKKKSCAIWDFEVVRLCLENPGTGNTKIYNSWEFGQDFEKCQKLTILYCWTNFEL